MRLHSFSVPVLALLLADVAPRCGEPRTDRPLRPVDPAPAAAVPTPKPAPTESAAKSWDPATANLSALDSYAGFSRDGLVFAWSAMNPGAGLSVMTFIASTTDTIEKTVPLTGETARREVMQELAEEGFPAPGTPPKLPPEVQASVQDGKVVVRFGPVPAVAPWKPFAQTPGIQPMKAEVVAVSQDGARAAIRVTGAGGGEFGPPVEWRIVELFK